MKAVPLCMAVALMATFAKQPTEPVAKTYEFNIPRESLDSALNEFAQVTGMQVARMSDRGSLSVQAGPLNGVFNLRMALENLLKGTDLQFEFVNERTVRIYFK